ncbi:MAG: DUF1177 domain-containing protein [Candidatus Aminicenantes bacterium]|jgi:hypothetical protein
MVLKHVLTVYDLLETPSIDIRKIRQYLTSHGVEDSEIETEKVRGDKGETEFLKIKIEGTEGKSRGGKTPTLGIIGTLGGIGARPEQIGLVSDAEGAVAALSCAAKIAEMRKRGDAIRNDIIFTTHLCPNAPTIPHEPVVFMGSPVSLDTMTQHEVDSRMEAILSIDTTRGNRVINHRGFAISPTVKDGYILRISEDLLDIMQHVTGKLPAVFPVTIQDITPYGNGLFHLNAIMQPASRTSAPVVGVAITSEVPVPGCATGANQVQDLEAAVRFAVEVAKAWSQGKCRFYDSEEYERIVSLYGSLEHFKK